MLTKSGVYKITNRKTGSIYVGCSQDIWGRWRIHYDMLERQRHVNSQLQDEWDQYGFMNFDFQILAHCAPDDIFEFEKHFVETIKAQIGEDKLFNIALTDLFRPGALLTDEQAVEIRDRARLGEVKTHLAEEFGVSYTTILNLCSGRTYTHLSV